MKYELSNKYADEKYLSKIMGPNPLKLTEELMLGLNIPRNGVVCDLGSGQGLTSLFLAKEYGFKVYAADLWSDPEENRRFFRSEGLTDDEILPVKADATALPFEKGFFDAVICVDSYNYFGRDPAFLDEKLLPFVKSGGIVAISVLGMKKDFHENAAKEDICKNGVKEDLRENSAIRENATKEDICKNGAICKNIVKENICESCIKEDVRKNGMEKDIGDNTVNKDIRENFPSELLLSWTPEQLDYIRDADYWRGIVSASKDSEIKELSAMESDEEVWADWLGRDNEYARNDRKSMDAGAGKYLNFLKIVLKKR